MNQISKCQFRKTGHTEKQIINREYIILYVQCNAYSKQQLWETATVMFFSKTDLTIILRSTNTILTFFLHNWPNFINRLRYLYTLQLHTLFLSYSQNQVCEIRIFIRFQVQRKLNIFSEQKVQPINYFFPLMYLLSFLVQHFNWCLLN